MTSLALLLESTTPGSVAAQSLKTIMERAPEGEAKWLLNEISFFNVPVKRRMFPKEATNPLRDSLDAALTMVLSLHKDSPLAFSSAAIYVLFPRLMLRPLPDGCQGRFAAAELMKR
jgi:hypothetical protein